MAIHHLPSLMITFFNTRLLSRINVLLRIFVSFYWFCSHAKVITRLWYSLIESFKALSVILNSKVHFFSEPPRFVLHIQRELHCNKLPMQQFSWKQHIFGIWDNSLLLGINYRRGKLIHGSVSRNKSLKFWFSYKFCVFFYVTRWCLLF